MQRLLDVLGAGDGRETVHAIGAALKMRDRAICAVHAPWSALQLHCAIAGESLRLARALRRPFDGLAPVVIQLRSDDAI
ncbi:hypothetical protein, partial [Xanthomonas translucens]|uniref:hypothetical protein n=1 Tax=Xanthomonas campestris pv. translucens TaxID=343 RepID=UPI002B41127B